MTTIGIVGAGHAGRALGRLLVRAGWRVAGVSCRSMERAEAAVAFIGAGRPTVDPVEASRDADIVLLAVPDGEILKVADRLRPRRGAMVAHLCGALAADALSPVRPLGAHTGALHPLRSFADAALAAEKFAGTYCAVDGDPEAVPRLDGLVRAIGGVPFAVAGGSKPLYHAGAVFASNYVVAVLEAALRLFDGAGVDRAAALEPVLALARGTLDNIAKVGIPAALTGPVERGDAGTVRLHVEAIRDRAPAMAEAYAALARLACEVALAKGTIDAPAAGRVNAELGSGAAGIRVPP